MVISLLGIFSTEVQFRGNLSGLLTEAGYAEREVTHLGAK